MRNRTGWAAIVGALILFAGLFAASLAVVNAQDARPDRPRRGDRGGGRDDRGGRDGRPDNNNNNTPDQTVNNDDDVVPVAPSANTAAVELELPDELYNYVNLNLPNHFTQNNVENADNEPTNNSVTNEGATLGRVLFYDKELSLNGTISCASCHVQENSFADPNQFSTGFEGGLTGRNSPGLANARYFEPGSFFWDQRASTLEDQVLMPIQDHIEMGLSLDELETRLSDLSYYDPLFDDAFGDEIVTRERISLALAQFVRAMVSYESKYDVGAQNGFDNFTNQEMRGLRLFTGNRTNCADCHDTDLQITDEAFNIGLDATTVDRGLADTTGRTNDEGKFKVPSLRNVAVTGPYMHDGRFATLEDVVEFYNDNIQDHPNLANELTVRNGNPREMNLSNGEQEALVAFLNTLTDESFLTAERFSDPFVERETNVPTAVAMTSAESHTDSTQPLAYMVLSLLLAGPTIVLTRRLF